MNLENSSHKKNLKRIGYCAGLFLFVMWLLTLISKSIYANKLPMVTTVNPKEQFITHNVNADGYVMETGELAINALTGVRVEKVLVKLGERLETGDPMIRVDLLDLEEIIIEKERQIKSISLQIEQVKENKELDVQKKELLEQRAQEDYNSLLGGAATSVSRAQQNYNNAEATLNNHRNNKVSITSDEHKKQQEDKHNQYQEAIANLEQEIKVLEEEIRVLDEKVDKTPEEQTNLESKKNSLGTAKNELATLVANPVPKPDYSTENNSLLQWEQEEQALVNAVNVAKQGLEDALQGQQKANVDGNRLLEDAKAPDRKDTQIEMSQLSTDRLQDELAKLKEVKKENGFLYATKAGIVKGVNVSAGSRISDSASIVLVDETMPYQLKAVVTSEERKYLEVGKEVDITLGGSRKQLVGEITLIGESTFSAGNYDVFVTLPDQVGTAGVNGTIAYEEEGERRKYCIPANAVVTENTRNYIYIVRERDGILGKELYVQRVDVKIVDQNDDFVAITEGILDSTANVIVDSTKEFKNGEVVRLIE